MVALVRVRVRLLMLHMAVLMLTLMLVLVFVLGLALLLALPGQLRLRLWNLRRTHLRRPLKPVSLHLPRPTLRPHRSLSRHQRPLAPGAWWTC